MNKRFKTALLTLALYISACGVKGDPVPPAAPAEFSKPKPTPRPLPKKRLPEYDMENDTDDDTGN